MRKRIFFNMLLLTSVSLVLITAALLFVFSGQLTAVAADGLHSRAETFLGSSFEAALPALHAVRNTDVRVTVVSPDGTVIYDNMLDAADLPSHAARPEIVQALDLGFGQSRRFSDTLREQTVYCAVRLADGFVLRLAKMQDSIFAILVDSLPLVLLLLLLMALFDYLLAGRLTRRIVDPVNRVGPDGLPTAPYEELAPFVRTIMEQRERIARQLADLQGRTDTINAIMDNMNEGLVLLDKQGTILSANRSLLRILQTGGPADGKNILELLREVSFSAHVRDALDGRAGEMTLERDGGVYRAYFSPVGSSGAIVLLLEITERAMAEQLRREFSANVSHELKTPLTSIYGSAELLCGGMVDEADKQHFYRKIKDEAARLIALIEDIILISKLDEGGGEALFERVDLAAAAAEAAAALAGKAAANGVTLTLPDGPVFLTAGRTMMYELFYNLIDNAIAYNTRPGTVRVEIARAGGTVCCTVRDSGIGIPKEAQGRVFERFYRVDGSRSRKTGGTGLGLAIVKHIVLLHGGTVSLDSAPGKGTTVTAAFPG